MGYRPLSDWERKDYEEKLKEAERNLKAYQQAVDIFKEKLEKGGWDGKD